MENPIYVACVFIADEHTAKPTGERLLQVLNVQINDINHAAFLRTVHQSEGGDETDVEFRYLMLVAHAVTRSLTEQTGTTYYPLAAFAKNTKTYATHPMYKELSQGVQIQPYPDAEKVVIVFDTSAPNVFDHKSVH